MAENREGAGCRDAALATLFLLGFAAVFMIAGLALADREGCRGLCESVGLTLLYAGGPISAMLGVIFGGVWVAWPLEVTLWVVIAFVVARRAGTGPRRVLGVSLTILLVALAYGLVLSQFVEIAA